MARKKAIKSSEKFVYRFTGEHGPEEFPTLGRDFVKAGELHESDVAIEHPRLVLVSGPKVKKESEPKEEAPIVEETSEEGEGEAK